MKTPPSPRVIESADLAEIARAVRDHDLTSTDLGEWSGTIDGQQVILRLVHPRDIVRARLQQTVTAAIAKVKREPKRTRQASIGETINRLRATARSSRWL